MFTHAVSRFPHHRQTGERATTGLDFLFLLLCKSLKGLVEFLEGLDDLSRGGGWRGGGRRREGGREGEGEGERGRLEGGQAQEGDLKEAAFGDGGVGGGRGG